MFWTRFIPACLATIALTASGCASTTSDSAALSVQVVTSPEAAGAVNSTLILGPTEVVVVDAQFTKSGATAVADAIDATGKRLSRVIITHAHPDHYLGTAVLAERFPNAEFIATPKVAEEMGATALAVAESRKDLLGPEFPGTPILPTAVDSDSIRVDGVEVQFMAGLDGDTHDITAVYIPSLGTLMGSDIVFSDVHAWTADTDSAGRKAWIAQLATLQEMDGLQRVVPGHQLQNTVPALSALSETSAYVAAFDAAVAAATDAESLTAAMTQAYPELKGTLFLQIGAGAAFPPPAE